MNKTPGHIVIFKTDDGKVSVDARFDAETAWLSLDQMAALFERDKSTVSRHIKNVFEEGELNPEATVAKFATVQKEGERIVERQVDYYNLDVIISVGYRVKSSLAWFSHAQGRSRRRSGSAGRFLNRRS